MSFANSPWFKYPALAVLGGVSGYAVARPSAKAPLVGAVCAAAAPLLTFFGARYFASWTPITGTPPTMIENLTPVGNAPKVGGKIPEGLDLVKAKFYRGEKTYKFYAAMEVDQGSFKTNAWWVLA